MTKLADLPATWRLESWRTYNHISELDAALAELREQIQALPGVQVQSFAMKDIIEREAVLALLTSTEQKETR